MTEAEYRSRLPDYLEGNLTEDEQNEMESHLTECSSCAEELNFLKRIPDAIARKPGLSSPGLWREIENQIVAEDAGIWSQFEWAGRRLVPILAATAVMIAVWSSVGINGSTSLEDYLRNELGESEMALLSNDDLSADDAVYLIHER